MTHLLDTNICIGLLRGRLPKTAARLQRFRRAEMTLCSVVLYELYLGTEKCSRPASEAAKVEAFVAPFVSLPFDDASARICAKIRADLEKAKSHWTVRLSDSGNLSAPSVDVGHVQRE